MHEQIAAPELFIKGWNVMSEPECHLFHNADPEFQGHGFGPKIVVNVLVFYQPF